jgi:drug/metabolite transporter superfamily protein YnfA
MAKNLRQEKPLWYGFVGKIILIAFDAVTTLQELMPPTLALSM